MGYRLDLKNPKTFSEKLQWLKINDHNGEYTKMVDKYLVKEYVSNVIGEEFVIPNYGMWDRPSEIEWDLLPDQFVLKTTHGGGSSGVVICKDKNYFDKERAIDILGRSLRQDIYKTLREWPYKGVQKRIFAEKYLEIKTGDSAIPDYKWYCFSGEPKYCQVIQNRFTEETIDFFDTSWNHLNFSGLSPSSGPLAKSAVAIPECPEQINTQIKIARRLSEGMPFARIDLYEIHGQVFFGEITFYPMSGFGIFTPKQYNEMLGQELKLHC